MATISLRFLLWSHFAPSNSAGGLAQSVGVQWPPPPAVSIRNIASALAGRSFQGLSVTPADEPTPARTTVDPGYHSVPAAFADTSEPNLERRLIPELRSLAALRDGDLILKQVCQRAVAAWEGLNAASPELLRAMTQLAVTGSNAFAKWSVNKTRNWVPDLNSLGMPTIVAQPTSDQIMADFDAAVAVVRNANGASANPPGREWIAASAEDDPLDYPVNVPVTPYAQFRLPLTVDGHTVEVRYFIASDLAPFPGYYDAPDIPPHDEVILYIHGEGSRAEEALDLIPRLFAAARAAGRSFTVVALDLPGCGYTTLIDSNGVRETPDHLAIAAMPSTDTKLGVVELSGFAGSPILDFVADTIAAFVEALVVPRGNSITAVVGGSLGGHMALRMASSGKPWVGNVLAWSPASVMDHTTPLQFTGFTVDLSQRVLADPQLAKRATEQEASTSRTDFFNAVWVKDTFNPTDYQIGTLVVALIANGVLPEMFAVPGVELAVISAELTTVLLSLDHVPPQPTLWYRDGWPSKVVYIDEARWERQEVYNANFRRWHWRVCEEMIGFTFDPTAVRAPLQLMVGEADNYPQVHFLDNVIAFAGNLHGPGRLVAVTNTGHSIHNERPSFLADQIIRMPAISSV